LVVGWHRLLAAKRLGWPTIRAQIRRMSVLEAQLAEINSNLCVAPLSPAQRLLAEIRREELIREEEIEQQ